MGATATINAAAALENWDIIDSLLAGVYKHSATVEISNRLYGHFSMAVFEQRHSLRLRGLVVDFDEQEDGSEDWFSVERKGVTIRFLRKK